MWIDTDDQGDAANRRRFLKAIGALGVTGLAGCGGDGDESTDTTEPGTPTETLPRHTTASDTPTETLPQHTTESATPTETDVNEQPLDDPADLLDFPGDLQAQPGTTVTIEGTVTNPYLFDVRNVEIALAASGDATLEAISGTSFETLETQAVQPAEWELTVPESASGEIDLTATVSYESTTDQAEVEVTSSVVVIGPVPIPYGLNAGGTEAVEYESVEFDFYNEADDPHPSVTLLYEEGEDPHTESGANGEGYEIEGTDKDEIYNVMMWGDNIGYEIPVTPGTYEVTFHLAEIYFGSGSAGCDPCTGQRIQNVSLQGELVFEELDLVERVGTLTALTETFEVEVDGEPIRIESEGEVAGAEDEHSMFNAIEIRDATVD